MTLSRFSLALLICGACTLASCSTINKTLDRTMSVFKPDAPATEDAATTGDAAAATPAGPVSRANYNTAVMTVDINGTRRKVIIELRPDLAPATVANFKKLVNSGFYNGLAWHRAIRGYLIQTGDPASKSDDKRNEWGLSDVGYKIIPEQKGLHQKGALAMARPGAIDAPDQQSSGSQFYVTLRSATKLDGHYSVFGYVTQGLDALDAISSMTVDTNDCPTKRFEVINIRLVPADSPELTAPQPIRRKTKSEYQKGPFEKLFDRFW